MSFTCFRVQGRYCFGLALLVLGLPLLGATGPIATEHVRGTISSVAAQSIVVDTAQGPVTIATDSTTGYIAETPATAFDIKPGTFIGTANVQRDGRNEAVEVHIFPESMRGTAEGDYSWDLPVANRGSEMTNGTTSAPHDATMTNGTVATSQEAMMTNGTAHDASMMTNGTVENGTLKPKMTTNAVPGARTIYVSYQGGSKEIVVAPDAKIVKFSAATQSIVTNGAHVLVIGAKNGSSIQAKLIVAGENGSVPPM